MAAAPTTVDIDCPRPGCEHRIAVPLEVTTAPPKPGAKPSPVNVRVRRDELSTRMAEHYRDAHPRTVAIGEINGIQRGLEFGAQDAGTFVNGLLEGLGVSDRASVLGQVIAGLPEEVTEIYVAPKLGVNFVEPFKVEIGDGRTEEGPIDV